MDPQAVPGLMGLSAPGLGRLDYLTLMAPSSGSLGAVPLVMPPQRGWDTSEVQGLARMLFPVPPNVAQGR